MEAVLETDAGCSDHERVRIRGVDREDVELPTIYTACARSASTLGIVFAAARLKLPIEVHAIVGSTENMTGSDPLLRLEPAAISSLGGIDTRLFCGFMLLLYEITVPLDRST